MTRRRPHHPDATRHIDWASATLLATGIICGAIGIVGFLTHGITLLVLIPNVFAAYTGAKNFHRYEAPRDL